MTQRKRIDRIGTVAYNRVTGVRQSEVGEWRKNYFGIMVYESGYT